MSALEVSPEQAPMEPEPVSENCVPGGVAVQSLTVLQRLIHRMQAPVCAYDLTADHACFGNAAMAALVGAPWPVPRGFWLTFFEEFADPSTAAQVKHGLEALRTGVMRSYQGDRSYVDRGGAAVHAHHDVTRLDLCDGPSMAIAVVTRLPRGLRSGDAAATRRRQASPTLVALDHHWNIEVLGPEAGPRLGVDTAELLGRPLLGLTHPEDRAILSAALGQVADMEVRKLSVRVGTDGAWRPARLLVGALCPHRPHRVGVVITLAGSASVDPAGATVWDTRFRGELAPQQQQVVDQLLQGESIASIASTLHLSRSTVRNHLCAVYAKAGVHSQAELIAFLIGRRRTPPPGPSA